jgi:hypothetical protein
MGIFTAETWVNGSAPALSGGAGGNVTRMDDGIEEAHDELNLMFMTGSRTLGIPGIVTAGNNKLNLLPDSGPWDLEVIELIARVRVAPTGGPLDVTVHYNDGTDKDLGTCSITGGTFRANQTTITNATVNSASYWQLDIDAVTGSPEDLVVDVWYKIRPLNTAASWQTPRTA